MVKPKQASAPTFDVLKVVADEDAFASLPRRTFLDTLHRIVESSELAKPTGRSKAANRSGINQETFVKEPSPPSHLEGRDGQYVSDNFENKLRTTLASLIDEWGAKAVFKEAAQQAVARDIFPAAEQLDDRSESMKPQNLNFVEAFKSMFDHATREERAEIIGAILPDARKVIAALAGAESIDYIGGQNPGLLLDAILRRKDMSVAEAAGQLGVARPHLYRILGGGTDISAAVAEELANMDLGSADHWLYLQSLHALDKLRSSTKAKAPRRKPSTPRR